MVAKHQSIQVELLDPHGPFVSGGIPIIEVAEHYGVSRKKGHTW